MDDRKSNQQTNPAPKTGREDWRIKHTRMKALKRMGLVPEYMVFPKELLDRPLSDFNADDSGQNS